MPDIQPGTLCRTQGHVHQPNNGKLVIAVQPMPNGWRCIALQQMERFPLSGGAPLRVLPGHCINVQSTKLQPLPTPTGVDQPLNWKELPHDDPHRDPS